MKKLQILRFINTDKAPTYGLALALLNREGLCPPDVEHRRFGYRRIRQLLRRERLLVNHKRTFRIYQLSGLRVKRRRRRKELATERFPLLCTDTPNLSWSMYFVMDAPVNVRRIECR